MTLPPGIRVAWREVPDGIPRREVSRALLAELLPRARFVSRCASCGGDHGRVRVEGTDAVVSVSYAPGWAVVAVALGLRTIGVDAAPRDADGLERVLPGEARAGDWARVEAVLKADGRGLVVDPARVTVTPGREGWWARIDGTAGDEALTWRGWDLDGPLGVVVAVAVPA